MSYQPLDKQRTQDLLDVANKIRIHSVTCTQAANSGHPTSSSSAAEILSVLYFQYMRIDPKNVRHKSSDRFILSKGHACPGLYGVLVEAGVIPEEQLKTLRKIDSDLEGHPTPRQDYIDVATGSLGQGLSIGAGMAYTGKYWDKSEYRVYVVMGDGETAEGSVWEATGFASHYKLDNLCIIVDVNRLGQSEATSLGHDVETYRKRFEAFGCNTIVVDGHDVEALNKAYHDAATTKDKPTALICKTFKGKGYPGVEDQENWHGKALGAKTDEALDACKKALANPNIKLVPKMFTDNAPVVDISQVKLSAPPNYKLGDKVATRQAYGTGLVNLGRSCSRIVGVDGDTKNSTFALTYKKEFPDRFVECFIAEQNLVGVAIGMGCRQRNIVFVSTFAAFFTRAFDQIRMGAISQSQVNFVGSHAGCSIGEDGPSQMALEDFACFRTVPGAVCFYPSDAVSCERALELAANHKGITFTRTSRPATTVIYKQDEVFKVGEGKVVKSSDDDKLTVVGCAVTLQEALIAYEELKKEGISIRVVDPFTLKPIDKDLLIKSAKATGGKILTVEDHYPEGGLGEAVAGAVSEESGIIVKRLAVNAIPRSGKGAELMKMFRIDSTAIIAAAKEMI